MQQIIGNLLNNAFKFTESGQILLHVEHLGIEYHTSMFASGSSFNKDLADNEESGSPKVSITRFSVVDTGIGISDEVQKKLFDPFHQADQSTSRQFGGSGLGLTICKRLVEAMGGIIEVTSDVGKGASFSFQLALEIDNKVEPHIDKPINLSGKYLLLQDNQTVYQDIISNQAAALGMKVLAVDNAKSMLNQLKGRELPDLIMFALGYPKNEGLALAKQLQKNARLASVPRLLLTETCRLPVKEFANSHGITNLYTRPTSVAQLNAMLATAFKGDCQSTEPEMEKINQDFSSLKVLVVEDNSVNRMVASGMLARFGIDAVLAENGEQAVELICTQKQVFNLILMDCEMPVMDGYTATRQIRQWEQDNNATYLNVYALTAHVLPEHLQLCHSAGMNGHIIKPVNLKRLNDVLHRVIADKKCSTSTI